MVDSVSSSTAAEVATTARQQARPAQEAQSRPAERREAEPPPRSQEQETKVTLSQNEPQPNTADRNAKPTEMYENVSVLR